MFETEVRAALRDLPLGGLRIFQTIGSSNDDALRWASEGAADLSLVVADEQTAGRGRSGRHWFTPAAASLALSLILRRATQDYSETTARLSGLGALAVTDACAQIGLPALIKWPNDILIGGRKAAGILVESTWSGSVLQASVVGIGVNVLHTAVPPDAEVAFPATCLETELGRVPDRITFLREVVSALLLWRPRLAHDSFIEAWADRLAFRDQTVTLTREGQAPLNGRLVGLEPDGSLRLAAQGRTLTVQFGELHLRPTNDRIG